jgi:hypothetical protein
LGETPELAFLFKEKRRKEMARRTRMVRRGCRADVLFAGPIAGGRTLHPKAVALARKKREMAIAILKDRVANGTATLQERRELIFKWGIRPAA